MRMHNPNLEEKARMLVGCEVEVVHARPDMGYNDEPFHHRGLLRGVDSNFLHFDDQWIALSVVEMLEVNAYREQRIR